MTLIAIMCGATDWPKVVVISEGLNSWLGEYVDMSAGVPCERTFKNLINALNPQALETVLQKLASLIREKKPLEVINFDGQTSKGTADRYAGLNGIHLVNAWSSDEKEGDYLLPVKGNQPALMEAVIDAFTAVEAQQALSLKQWERAVEKAKEHRDVDRLQQLVVKGAPTRSVSLSRSSGSA